MADVIHFHCPACGTSLRLPLAQAAVEGPCPDCGKTIIAPDPATGTGAHAAPAVAPAEPSEKLPEPKPPAGPSPRTIHPQRTILVLSCLLTGVAGYLVGARSVPPPAAPAVPQTAPIPKPAPATAPAVIPEPPPRPLKVKPVIEAPKAPEPGKASAAAEDVLRAFLEAPDWAARSAYVLFPDKIRGAMEAYSRTAADGPTPFVSLTVKQSHLAPSTGLTLYIFSVATEEIPAGIPVAVQETPAGWLVDWQPFVEFRDGLFQQFVDGPVDRSGIFHLIVTTPPPSRAEKTENEHFSSFLLQPPLDVTPQIAFVRKSSEGFRIFRKALADGGMITPVLEVVKRKTADDQSYFEVLRVVSTDWLPAEANLSYPAP